MSKYDELFNNLINTGWFKEEEIKPFKTEQVINLIDECKTPKNKNDIFRALINTPFNKVKVVIIGQDPYPNPDFAHGLAFSTDDKKCPGSLKNIYKALNISPSTNNLSKWADNGVLLLNSALTYSETSSLAKRVKIWRPFIDNIIKKILSVTDRKIVFFLWGNDAQKVVFRNLDESNIKGKKLSNETVFAGKNKNILILQSDTLLR